MAVISLIFVFVPAGDDLWSLSAADYLQITVGFEIFIISVATVWYSGLLKKNKTATNFKIY